MIALQSYKSQTGVLSKAIRSNCTGIVFYGMRDEKALQGIFEEMGREIEPEVLSAAFDYATSGNRHNACFVIFDNGISIRRNLDEVIDLDSIRAKKSEEDLLIE